MKNLLILLLTILSLSSSCFANQPTEKQLDEYLSQHTLVIINNGNITFHDENGIKPLINAINNNELQGAYIADRITGKAAALLYAYGGVSSVYSQVLAKPAIKILKQNKIKYKAKTTTKYIINRSKTGLCPMEQKVLNVNNPDQAWEIFASNQKIK